MQIYHSIEELSFLKQHISDTDLYEIAKMYPVDQWVRAATYFLNGLSPNHLMIGKTLDTMRGICQYYTEHEQITWKQQIYLVGHLIQNWQEISYEYRGYVTM